MSGETEIPAVVARFRETARRERIPARYSGPAHVVFTAALCLGGVGLGASRVEAVAPLEWLTVPLTFLVANLGEYLGHRGPMHHSTRGLERVWRRHTGEHHRFFTHEAMSYGDSRDYYMVLFPPVLQIFFLGGLGAPLALLAFLLFGANVGWLFVASVAGYYGVYEVLHFSHHLAPQGPLGRSRLLAALRRHHQLHHDPRFMLRANFNISFPLFDVVFGTRRGGDEG